MEANMGEAARKAAATAPPMRPEMRADPRAEMSDAARAKLRAAEILGHADILDDGPDVFYFDRSKIPEGWDYEWKVLTVYGKEYPAEMTKMARTGWTPVPRERHPEEMPKGSGIPTIEREGQILMERPLEVSKYMREKDNQGARDQVQQKLEQLSNAPPGQLERRDAHGKSLAKVRRTVEPMRVPA